MPMRRGWHLKLHLPDASLVMSTSFPLNPECPASFVLLQPDIRQHHRHLHRFHRHQRVPWRKVRQTYIVAYNKMTVEPGPIHTSPPVPSLSRQFISAGPNRSRFHNSKAPHTLIGTLCTIAYLTYLPIRLLLISDAPIRARIPSDHPLQICTPDPYHIFFHARRWGYYDGVQASMPATAVCIAQTFPVADFVGPAAASLRGATGFEILSGGNIFGAFDNGFANVRPCCPPALHKPYLNPSTLTPGQLYTSFSGSFLFGRSAALATLNRFPLIPIHERRARPAATTRATARTVPMSTAASCRSRTSVAPT